MKNFRAVVIAAIVTGAAAINEPVASPTVAIEAEVAEFERQLGTDASGYPTETPRRPSGSYSYYYGSSGKSGKGSKSSSSDGSGKSGKSGGYGSYSYGYGSGKSGKGGSKGGKSWDGGYGSYSYGYCLGEGESCDSQFNCCPGLTCVDPLKYDEDFDGGQKCKRV